MGKSRLISVIAFLALLWCSCTKGPKCTPIVSDFEQAYDTFPFGKSKFVHSSSQMRISYGTNLGSGYTTHVQPQCPKEIKRTKSASHNFNLLGISIAVRLAAAPNGNHITVLQTVNNGPNAFEQHIISHNVEANKTMGLYNAGYTGLRTDYTLYTDIDAYYASDFTILDEEFAELLVLTINSEMPTENRLVRTYYIHKSIGLVGFVMQDGTIWKMW